MQQNLLLFSLYRRPNQSQWFDVVTKNCALFHILLLCRPIYLLLFFIDFHFLFFRLVNVLSRPTHSAVYRQRQSVSCCVRSSVQQSSIACHRCPISSLSLSLSLPLLSKFLTIFSFFSLVRCPRSDLPFWTLYRIELHYQ